MQDLLEGAGKHASSRNEAPFGGRLGYWLGRAEVGEARALGGLRIHPIIHRQSGGEPFVLLHEALAAGTLKVTESGGGVVNEVIAHNLGDRPVLALESESVVGARQNRVVVTDVLVPPGKSVPLPVGCVERGRWHWTSPEFAVAGLPVDPEVRQSMKTDVAYLGALDQGRLWRNVEGKLVSACVASPTSDYHRYVDERRGDAEERARSFHPVPGQVGILALHEGALVGFDVVGHPDNWAALSGRLLSAYGLSDWAVAAAARGRTRESRGAEPRTAEQWLSEIAVAEVQLRPSPGMGQQLVLMGECVTGGGLWFEDRPAHLAVFPAKV